MQVSLVEVENALRICIFYDRQTILW
jgi:hypothetical protein